MPDDLSAAGDELAALRAANVRLRQVVEAKDIEIAALRAAVEAGQARQAELIRRLELRVAELERRLGMDSSNSGAPTSKEPAGVLTAFLVCDGYEAYPRYPCCPAGTR